LEELLAKKDICIAIKEKLVKDSGVAGEHAYDSIVQKLLTKPRARGKSATEFVPNRLELVEIHIRSLLQHYNITKYGRKDILERLVKLRKPISYLYL